MMNQATKDFIREHQEHDVRQLAFLGSKHPEVDLPFALDQIRGRKMACAKLPRWASIEGIVYPPHISMEQCSSEHTALYKAELAARLLGLPSWAAQNQEQPSNSEISKICGFPVKDSVAPKFAKNEAASENEQILTVSCKNVNEIKWRGGEEEKQEEIEFVDLTGGFGVDFSYIAERLGVKSMYVERQAHLCEAAKENFMRLGLKNVEVKNGDGIEVLCSFPNKDVSSLKLIFIDPARRDDAGNKVVSLQDCTPDVTLLQDEMLSKADFVIIKLSPMLDWHRAVSELKHVREVHIVSTGNECKELLLVLSARGETATEAFERMKEEEAGEEDAEALQVYCINDHQHFVFEAPHEAHVSIVQQEELVTLKDSIEDRLKCSLKDGQRNHLMNLPYGYLYEPNASLMKAGCFGAISERYGVKMLAHNSHLFVSEEQVEGFPGRSFRIKAISTFNKKELKRQLAGITKANIATRNFPLSVAELRKRLKLKDGGDTYLFATTLSDESHVLLIAGKMPVGSHSSAGGS